MVTNQRLLKSLFLGSLIIVSVSLIGCNRKVEERTPGFIDFSNPNALQVDLNSIEGVIEINNDSGPMYDGQVVSIERDLVIGVEMEGPEWQLFSGYPHLLVAPDGGMIIGDSRSHDFYLVDDTGALIRRIGGSGGGPGEYRQVRNVLWIERGNEFWISDSDLMRISRYGAAGDLLGTINVSSLGFQLSFLTSAGDGFLIAMGLQSRVEDQVSLSSFAVIDTSFQVVLDFGDLPYQRFLMIDGSMRGTMPYGQLTQLSAFPDGKLLLTFPHEGIMVILSATGEVLTRIHGVGEHRRFSEAEKRWYRGVRASGPRGVKDADKYLPQFLPYFGQVIADDRGRIWVFSYRTNREIRDSLRKPKVYLYTSNGKWIGTQELNFSFRKIWGDHGYRITGLLPDEFPSVERWQIIPLVPEAAGNTEY